ncbi:MULTISPECIES: peptidylprolyl isomerase [Oleiagrimonas]|uniref:Peptidyl-prolyl cis-trans isomerase n=1 Tax=Oleiagrimonas citrea TaxID=1665687 RepID=A0A846ZGS7_9GAMM|nr:MULTISPECIES: peptidylprolyl isomerase [Oleiagrimonas]NKZ37824.1 peptidyl-prolyl cis-trans isomerase [Oleiagrimonas citrea]RAP57528.1 peptidylprolyl isomerase [Oleiagrimonas sp. MCCC 1A03011]
MQRILIALAFLLLSPALCAQQDNPAPASSSAAGTPAPNPEVRIHTSMGDITLELFPHKSPKSVANFLQYVRDGFYDGTVFHRVIDGYLIQGGLYTRELTPKRTRAPVQAEADNGLSNLRGTIAVARGADPNSGTAQFFINLVDNRRLDYTSDQSGLTWGYTVFGKVIQGMDVVDKIAKLPTHPQGPFAGDVPKPLVIIESAKVIGEDQPASNASAATPAKAASAANAPKADKATAKKTSA